MREAIPSLLPARHALDNVDWNDEFSYVREMYGVPAKKDMRIVMDGREGRIVAGDGARLLILRDGDEQPVPVHPCWRMHYIIEGGERVQTHYQKAKRKLRAKTRTHAVALAIRQGLL